MSSMDTAIYWVEYVIRHGSDALRSPAMDLTWWQIELLDVYAALLLIAVLSLLAVIAMSKFACNFFFYRKELTVPGSKKAQ